MNEPPIVSVIIPAYNSTTFLPRAIESLENQTISNFEAILVDDGSEEPVFDVIPKDRPWFSYHRQDNRGLSAARNYGISKARGKYLVFLDADDWLSADKLEIQSIFLEGHPEICVVYSDGYLVMQHEKRAEELVSFSKAGLLKKNLGSPEQNVKVLSNGNAFPVHAAMVRSEAVREVGGFNETPERIPLEDWDLWYRIGEKCQFAFQDSFTAFYRIHQSSMSSNQKEMLKASLFIEQRIQQSNGFKGLNKHDRARSITSFGLSAIQYGDTTIARQHFDRAIKVYPWEIRAWIGFMMCATGYSPKKLIKK